MLAVMAMLTLNSCIYDATEPGQTADGTGEVRLLLRLRSMAGAETASDTESGIVEKVKSLRVIILDAATGKLEVNQQVTPEQDKNQAAGFEYVFMRMVKPGNKRIYVIANEESVGPVVLTDAEGLPSLPLGSLTALLDYFRPGGESATPGRNLETVLNRVYFRSDPTGVVEDGAIYLPYSSCYDITIEEAPLFEVEKPLYLVPAATKMTLVFVNYRKENAQVDDVIISSLNTNNFLCAQLPEEEQTRQYDEKNLWWIDWLQICAEESQKAQDVTAFNNLWGWIKDYEMPVPEEPMVSRSLNTRNDIWVVDALVDKSRPSKITVGPFYLPESKHLVPATPTGAQDDDNVYYQTANGTYRQSYTLAFKVHDELSEEVSFLEGYEIDTLKALFRATHVIVTVEFYESQVEIYAEIAPWEKRQFLGFVQQDDD